MINWGSAPDGDALAEAHKGQPRTPAAGRPAAGKGRRSGGKLQGLAQMTTRNSSVSHIQWGVVVREKGAGAACTQGRVLPYSRGAEAGDRCNRNRAGQVGARTVKCWRDGGPGLPVVACSSAGSGGA